jgi:hypothetical protein
MVRVGVGELRSDLAVDVFVETRSTCYQKNL